MGESDNVQLIIFSSIAVTQKGIVTQTLPFKISSVLIVKITSKLQYTFRMIPLIIFLIKVVIIIDPLNQVPRVFLYNKESSDPFSTC